jgi:hypothetical protein
MEVKDMCTKGIKISIPRSELFYEKLTDYLYYNRQHNTF